MIHGAFSIIKAISRGPSLEIIQQSWSPNLKKFGDFRNRRCHPEPIACPEFIEGKDIDEGAVFCYNEGINKESYMPYSDAFLGEMKKRLQEEKQQLEKELGSFTHKGKSDHYISEKPEVGELDDENAQEVAQYQNELSVEPTLEKRLRRVNKALARLTDGTYGVCDDTETPEARLEADPSAGAIEHRDEME